MMSEGLAEQRGRRGRMSDPTDTRRNRDRNIVRSSKPPLSPPPLVGEQTFTNKASPGEDRLCRGWEGNCESEVASWQWTPGKDCGRVKEAQNGGRDFGVGERGMFSGAALRIDENIEDSGPTLLLKRYGSRARRTGEFLLSFYFFIIYDLVEDFDVRFSELSSIYFVTSFSVLLSFLRMSF